MKDNANPVTRGGTKKHQSEPEKYIETVKGMRDIL